MRRFLILLMIALLPLRGWAGDVMGIQMSMMDAAMSTADAMPPGCPMHAQAEASTDSEDVATAADMKKCANCHLCIPLAATAEVPTRVCVHAMHVQPLMGGGEFDSAPLALALKPPIS